jgi:hypothetical protein
MANEYGITYQAAEQGVQQLTNASNNLSNLVNVIRTDVSNFVGQGWVGNDADAYKNSLDSLTQDLDREAENIINFANQIQETAVAYAEDERNRASSAQNLNA